MEQLIAEDARIVLPEGKIEAGTICGFLEGIPVEVRQTIQAHPTTLLASLIEDISIDCARAIFIDANSERFGYILDWYRFRQMHIPKDYPVKSILCDARFFLFPDYVKIDGTSYCICPGASNNAFDAVSSPVIDRWLQFEQYVSKIIAEVRSDAEAAASARSDVINGEVFLIFNPEASASGDLRRCSPYPRRGTELARQGLGAEVPAGFGRNHEGR